MASQTAVEIIGNMLGRDIRPGIGAGEIKSVLECAVAGANATVHDMARRKPELKGMGTTIVAAVVLGATVYLLSAGDSRAYRYSKGEVSPADQGSHGGSSSCWSGGRSPRMRPRPIPSAITSPVRWG